MFGFEKIGAAINPSQRVYLGNQLADKIEKIRIGHHKKFVRRLWKRKAAALICVILSLPVAIMVFDDNTRGYGLFLAFILYMAYDFVLLSIFKLGNEDDREYFLSCIDAAEDEYELEAMGFDRIGKIEEILNKRNF